MQAHIILNNELISEKLKLGLLTLVDAVRNGKPMRSRIYKDNAFKWISNQGTILDSKVACTYCMKVCRFSNHTFSLLIRWFSGL